MKGITVPCPYCKKILLRYAVVKGEATFETLCPHCKELVTVCYGHEPWITATKTKVIVTVLILAALYQVFTLYTLKSTVTALINEYDIEIRR